jgi:hypothetical protein
MMIETQDALKIEVLRRWAGTVKDVSFHQDIHPVYSWDHPDVPYIVPGRTECKLRWEDNRGRTHERVGDDINRIFWFDTMDQLLEKDSPEDRWLQDQGNI